MKKKLIPLITALVCVIACALCLVACDGGKDVLGVRITTAENTSEKKESIDIGKYVYGEDEKINGNLTGIKFYKQFDDGTYAEINESELTVAYVKDGEPLSAKPAKYTTSKYGGESHYQINYSIDGKNNTSSVTFTVENAKSDEFSISLSQTSWKYGASPATVTVKNPAGEAMEKVGDDGIFKEDNSQYVWAGLYSMKKTDYNQAGANAKAYALLTNNETDENGYHKYFGNKLLGYNDSLRQGEYVLIACISSTRYYKEIVCTAEFTITAPESPLGKTFVFTDWTASGDSGAPAPGDSAEIAENMKSGNLANNAKVICQADGTLKGSFDFGAGTFDELEGDDVLTLTFNPETLEVEVKSADESMRLSGYFVDGTLTLRLMQTWDSDPPAVAWFHLTFKLQTAEN